jgi:signal transduction histidine kinase
MSFSLIGCAIAVELERTARDTFLRERQLRQLNLNLEDSQDEMQVKTAALVAVKEDLRSRAEQENINKSKFLADAAHDLRQPLQGLSGFLEAAEVVTAQPGMRLR